MAQSIPGPAPYASVSVAGLVSTGTQSLAGAKTFTSDLTTSGSVIANGVTLPLVALAVSAAGTARLRYYGGSVQASLNGGAYSSIIEAAPSSINVKDFGAVGDGATDDWSAFDTAIRSMNTAVLTVGKTLIIPPGTYYFTKPLEISRCVSLQGAGRFGVVGAATTLKFAIGCHGLVFQGPNTSTDGGRSDGSSVKDLQITAVAKAAKLAHGVTVFTPNVRLSNVTIDSFSGDGLNVDSSHSVIAWAISTAYTIGDCVTVGVDKYSCVVAGTSSNVGTGPSGTGAGPLHNGIIDGTAQWRYVSGLIISDAWYAEYCAFTSNGRNGIYTIGGDSNVGAAVECQALYNTGYGIYEMGFLGNHYEMIHMDGNLTGQIYATNPNCRATFINCYSEGGSPTSTINAPATVIGGLHAAGLSGTYAGIVGAVAQGFSFSDTNGATVGFGSTDAGTASIEALATGTLSTYRKIIPTNGTYYPGTAVWNWANAASGYGHGMAGDHAVYNVDITRNRWMPATSLFTGSGFGLYNEGRLITHRASPTTEVTWQNTFFIGDIVFNTAHVLGGSVGWVCTVAGTNGTYTEGLTATSAGGTSLTLSAATSFSTGGLRVGAKIVVNATTVHITAISANGLTLTVSGAVPAGAGLAITYSPPVFKSFGTINSAVGVVTLTDAPSAPVSTSGLATIRQNGSLLQASVNGGAYASLGPGWLNVKDFGAVGDGVTDDYAAFDAAIASMDTGIDAYSNNGKGNTLYVPVGNYYLSRTLHIRRGMVLLGASGAQGGNSATKLIFAAGHDGLCVDRYNTSQDGGPGDASVIKSLYITTDGKVAASHGIRLFARASIQDCLIASFGGNGIQISAGFSGNGIGGDTFPAWAPTTTYYAGDFRTNDAGKIYVCKHGGVSAGSGGPTGSPAYNTPIADGTAIWGFIDGTNANGWAVTGTRIYSCDGHGIYTHGSDVNAGVGTGVDVSSCGGYGIYDDGFLGNTWTGCEVATCTLGSYHCTGANARSVFNGCYGESDQPPGIVNTPSQVYGGLHANEISGTGIKFINASMSGKLALSEGNLTTLSATATTYGTTTILLTDAVAGILPQDYLIINGLTYTISTVSADHKTLTTTVNIPAASGQTVQMIDRLKVYLGDIQNNTILSTRYFTDGGTHDLKYIPIAGDDTPVNSDIYLWDLSNSSKSWGFGRTPSSALSMSGVNDPRSVPGGSLFTYLNKGILNEGHRIIHSDDPTTRTESNFQFGDFVYRTNGVTGASGDNIGWMCTDSGTLGTYSEGRTLTTDGTFVATLNAATSVLSVGDGIRIAGNGPYIITGIDIDRKKIHLKSYFVGAPGAASGQAITYVAPSFVKFGNKLGNIGDSSGSPGNATLNKRHGVSSFATGASSVTVTCDRVPASACIIHATLQTSDATLTRILNVIPNPAGGSFVVNGDANATATTNFCWSIDE